MEVIAFGDGVNTVWFGQGMSRRGMWFAAVRALEHLELFKSLLKRMVTRYGRNHCIRTAKDDGFLTKLD